MTIFDGLALGTILVLMLISMMRGLVSEVVALARWVVGLLAAWLFAGTFAELALSGIQPPALAHAVAFVAIFVLVFIVMYMLRELLNAVVSKIGLGGVNRILGGVFGCIKGIALVTLVVMLCRFTDLPSEPAWQMSLSAPFFESLGQMALPYVKAAQNIPPAAP
ncbi:MAG: CvpA family protein [Neisseria sp.]|nr:CvpA family protein [Neisseria sp.]